MTIKAVAYKDGFCFVTYMTDHEYTIMAKSLTKCLKLLKGKG